MQKSTFTASDGAKIAFADQGHGHALLCLAGLTRDAADFDYLLPHLPAGWRVIRMDYRGRGGSDWSGAASYTVPRESRDVVELLDHLRLPRAAVLGTSRGGLNGLFLCATAKERLAGLCLNDVGPALEWDGLARIKDYIGRAPAPKTLEAYAKILPAANPGMVNVPDSRWREEAERHVIQRPEGGLANTYDPALREAFLAAFEGDAPDLWPLFDAAEDLPLALIRGANSDLLSESAALAMKARRPDMIFGTVPDRAHIPFLDEPVSVQVIHDWLAAVIQSGRLSV